MPGSQQAASESARFTGTGMSTWSRGGSRRKVYSEVKVLRGAEAVAAVRKKLISVSAPDEGNLC